MNPRTAVILFNLGGPDGQETVKPFLYNFFMDPNIIGLPWPLRKILATLISSRRSKREAGVSYELLGWTSPLLKNSQAQADALEQVLNAQDGHYKCFVCMRYWHPRADDIVGRVKEFDPARILLLPFYPQYSTATTRSSFQDWGRAAKKAGLAQPVAAVCCYPLNDGFIAASAKRIRDAYVAMSAQLKGGRPPRVLFSAHGLPEKTILAGDPYQQHCEQTAHAIVEKLDLPSLDWQMCYQSRVGPMKWIGPSTIEALEKAAADHVPVLVYPHAFVSEHVETLVEINIEYRHLAEKLGVPGFQGIETVGAHADFIKGLAALVQKMDGQGLRNEEPWQACHNKSKCCLRDQEMIALYSLKEQAI